MPPILAYVESALGTIFSSSKGRDDKLITRAGPHFLPQKKTITITSNELGATSPGAFTAGKHELLGDNLFPHLSWTASSDPKFTIHSWLLICEDADVPLPTPVVHGIFYDIPVEKTEVTAEDFEKVKLEGGIGLGNEVKGGFRHGVNRRGSVWIGPRPVTSHGNHRYFFTVVGLKTKILGIDKERVTGEELKYGGGILESNVVCWGEYVANFERKLFK